MGGGSAQSAGSSGARPVARSASKKAPAPLARAHSSKLSDSASAATEIAASASNIASEPALQAWGRASAERATTDGARRARRVRREERRELRVERGVVREEAHASVISAIEIMGV